MTAFPKPGFIRKQPDPVRVMSDGREIIRTSTYGGRVIYRQRVHVMWQRQGGRCGLQISPQCQKNLLVQMAEFEHVNGRGMGGAKRDDRIVVDGKPHNLAVCRYCNALKGSRPLHAVKSGGIDARRLGNS